MIIKIYYTVLCSIKRLKVLIGSMLLLEYEKNPNTHVLGFFLIVANIEHILFTMY